MYFILSRKVGPFRYCRTSRRQDNVQKECKLRRGLLQLCEFAGKCSAHRDLPGIITLLKCVLPDAPGLDRLGQISLPGRELRGELCQFAAGDAPLGYGWIFL